MKRNAPRCGRGAVLLVRGKLDFAGGGGGCDGGWGVHVGGGFGDAELLQDAGFVGAAPALDHFCVGVEFGDLDAAGFDLFAGGGDALEGALLGAGDGVGDGYAVVVGGEVLDGDFEVREGVAELGEEADEAFGAGALIGGGVVVLYVGREEVVELFEVAAVDGFAHFLGGCDVCFFAHGVLLGG